MNRITRRRFTQLLLGEATLLLLGGCTSETSNPTPSGTPTPTFPPLTPVPPTPTRPILRNEDRPGFFVRYYKPFAAVDPARWSLSVEGLVKRPLSLSLADVQSLPRVAQVSRLKCVECWSAVAKWEGFHLRSLLSQVEPTNDATWLHFYCADGYYESLPLDTLLAERVIFAHRMNDLLLPDPYGAPLRLIVPAKYGYKGPKAITRLVFASKELPGYWPVVGGYDRDGEIQPGPDHPLDLGGVRRIPGGEVRYPDGRESQS